jgi:hypothetical protein
MPTLTGPPPRPPRFAARDSHGRMARRSGAALVAAPGSQPRKSAILLAVLRPPLADSADADGGGGVAALDRMDVLVSV